MNNSNDQLDRLLVHIVAYEAETTLKDVLDRIPNSVFEELDVEILIVDDASEDRTFELGHEYALAHPELPLTVLRNENNQGYGGNQKIGYAYASANGFDYVALIHGDGQYAPEELGNLLRPLMLDEADAVFGSRMIHKGGALKTEFPNALGDIAYQVACHQRVQNIGLKTRDVLNLVQDTQVTAYERCSGHDGTYAVKKETHDKSVKIARPVVRKVDQQDPDHFMSDCPMAATHIANLAETVDTAEQPMSLLCRAYGLE